MANPPYWAVPQAPKKKPPRAQEPPEEYEDAPPAPITEADLPDFLQRGRQFAPKSQPLSHKQIPPTMQKQAARIDSYYQETPDPVAPAPKRKRISAHTVLNVAALVLCFAGLALALITFTYARGVSNMATSVSFLHAEIGLLFVVQAVMFMYFSWKKEG